MLERRIFDLLDGVQVYCVVICAEFFTLEELDGCLIKLQHNNLVKKTEALDVTIGALDIVVSVVILFILPSLSLLLFTNQFLIFLLIFVISICFPHL